ncbi:hypothetical protein BH92_06190 [Rhodococcoides fascians A21d2]|uniref:hypothetical protein n=1 Tax=Nocardiaceae TaxID=85025 RepID=UPI00055B4E9C|nr:MULTISPECIES: hypothetical protein [Rhodococcus]OZC41414.1 hypothetical protein CH286_27270 [Rhodococcus sp. WWJCD1]OZC41447.1 hypothetical protein CH286_27465 [Rhodococcus sp. WWJCD1]QIH99509.1 hypothetical protein BH92_06190 [Rhodococcus fascians A21d2]
MSSDGDKHNRAQRQPASFRRESAVWFPISLAFALTVTFIGVDLRAIVSNPAVVLFGAVFVVLSLIPGAIVSFFAVAATRVADRLMRETLSKENTHSVASLHGTVAGLVSGLLTWCWLPLNGSNADTASVIIAVAIVALVAAISAARGLIARRSSF